MLTVFQSCVLNICPETDGIMGSMDGIPWMEFRYVHVDSAFREDTNEEDK